jgi:thiol:disulfide interchange protein
MMTVCKQRKEITMDENNNNLNENPSTNSTYETSDANQTYEDQNTTYEASNANTTVETAVYSTNTSSSSYTPQEPVPKGFAIVSLVLGIGGILTSCCCGLGSVFCIMGIIFGCIQEKGPDGTKPGQATAGIILSIIGLCLSILSVLYIVIVGMAGIS